LAGVCREETFDVTPYARAIAKFLLGHPDTQDFGRKFKIAFSGCAENACGLVAMHDLGFIARTRADNGKEKRGFEAYVGGGLGTVPYKAKLLDPFVPEEEILPLAQAISRVFARLGEKKNRARARIKFLVNNLGIDEFRKLVQEERSRLSADPRWTDWLDDVPRYGERPAKTGESLNGAAQPEGFAEWRRTNVYAQRQPGYAVVSVTLPMGDITSRQMRRLADIARRYSGDNVRTTVEQNIVLRWVSESDLPALYRDLCATCLGTPGAGTIVDVVACPGTDTCKLGIASSRGLASELGLRLAAKQHEMDEAVRGLHIKISGCFNSCGQHHVCDLGFYGVSRKIGGTTVPHFQVMLGGEWENNAGAYGLAIGAVPSKRVPDFVTRITEQYLTARNKDETFHQWVTRVGKKTLRSIVDEFTAVPPYEQDRTYYSDWRDPREFTVGDMGVGECAGEVVARIDFDLQEAERKSFEAQVLLEAGEFEKADTMAYRAMLEAARGSSECSTTTFRPSRTRSSRSFASGSSTRSCSGTSTRAASSPSISSSDTTTRRRACIAKRRHTIWSKRRNCSSRPLTRATLECSRSARPRR
jgi:sulfite reductase (ferredoxin)